MDDWEETLLVVPECFVYKIPPRTSADGYRAKDWNIQSYIWSGRLVMKAKGDSCTIRLEDAKTGDLFAVCPVPTTGPKAVEPVTDSSRYFVLRIEDGKGHHAFIGMGFTDRNEAFDFNVALQEHAKEIQRRKEAAEAERNPSREPAKDYSLKQGQTIKVNLKTTTPKRQERSLLGDTGGSGFPLPPPPASSLGRPGDSQPKLSNDPLSGFPF